MQIQGLSRGNVADIPGAVTGGTNYKLQKDAVAEQKKQENTQWLAQASKYGLDNWGQPGVLEGLLEEAKRRGIVEPTTTAESITKQGMIKMYRGAMSAVGGPQGLPERQDPRTVKQKDYEYGQQNPQFAANQKPDPRTVKQKDYEYGLQNPGFNDSQVATADQTSDIENYEYYTSLKTDDERANWIKVKRGNLKPSSAIESRLLDLHDKAFEARAKAHQYTRLADDLIRADPESGKIAEWTENLKTITGDEDAVTLLRKRWNQLRVGAAVQNLPPGVASDKDIELVMSAYLPEFANPETVASFMRGLAKVETLNAEYREFESDYLSRPPHSPVGLSRAWDEYLAERNKGAVQVGRFTVEQVQ